ncbi:hypothetical protein OUZ56_012484 [Daphnia magna]|uniref:Uncharacterized protein n=1 Tax=Daphnia magna TaxID=35525 RepID=A0ABQ9Z350_9CRUS|nr:hypothetical protein OUZ56_012484 [Daphnia magna]
MSMTNGYYADYNIRIICKRRAFVTLQSYRENVKQGEDNRKSLKDELLKGLMYSNECQKKAPNKDLDIVHSNATYYLCGYLVHSRAERINCNICLASLSTEENQLPSDFYASHITSLIRKGFLRFASLGMFYTFVKVEKIKSVDHMEAKRLKNEVSQKLKEEQHKLRKLSKMKKTA